jgi:flavodoxin
MNTAVVFYSATGNCALAARALSEKLGAKLIELKEKKSRDLSKVGPAFMGAAFRAILGVRSALQGEPWEEAAGCGELHMFTPIWASRPAPAVNTFASKFDFKGKKVTLYTVQADPNDTAKGAREKLAARIRNKGGEVVGTHGLTGAGPGEPPKADLVEKVKSL